MELGLTHRKNDVNLTCKANVGLKNNMKTVIIISKERYNDKEDGNLRNKFSNFGKKDHARTDCSQIKFNKGSLFRNINPKKFYV